MPDLLLELGCEELPATFVRKAFQDLHDLVLGALREAELLEACFKSQCMGTPRRLIVSIEGLLPRQADQTKEQRGPALKAAYDDAGNPTQALLGFCRGAGVNPSELRKDDQYVWAAKHIPGRPVGEILAETLPRAIRSLSFEKSMRWGAAKMRFARPIRWILASLDGSVVDFEIEGVHAGLKSYGHRFYEPEPFTATGFEALIEGLRARKVEPDPAKRRERIVAETNKVAPGEPEMPEALIEENVYLTEWPTAILGEFREQFLELPPQVLVTAMAKHEKMFPVRTSDGRITNKFVFIRNSGEDATVRAGAEWVLNARFNDAKFFFDQDREHDLDYFLEKTAGIVFHAELGTVRQRADRLEKLAFVVAQMTGASAYETSWAQKAARLAKADLSTGLVSELPSLQGAVGGEYARREGLPDPVCWAIASHYDLAKNPKIDCEGARTAVRLLVADQLDKLAGYLGKGMAPSGSSDPFGLRRSATMLIEAAWAWPTSAMSYPLILSAAIGFYNEPGADLPANEVFAAATALFGSRYEALLPQVRHDLLEAATSVGTLDPQGVRMRIQVMEILATDQAFVFAATRPINIVAAARKKGIEFGLSTNALDSAEGEALRNAQQEVRPQVEKAAMAGDAGELAGALKSLQKPIDAFFEATMVMVEDETIRNSRLALLECVSKTLKLAGDFSKIVFEG